uniref:Uncharacterized protein n=1 Tax=Arion vulgaris TaxID=1028688 RepID=A0A0B7AG41_9EUPU
MITSHTRIHVFVAQQLATMGHKVWCAVPSAFDKRKSESYPGVTTYKYIDFWETSEEMLISELEGTIYKAFSTWNEWKLSAMDVDSMC